MADVTCGNCGNEYPDSEPICRKCGEPFRLNSLSTQRSIKEETGTATRIGSASRGFHKTVNIQLRFPGKLVAAVFLVMFAGMALVLNLIFGWLFKR